MAYATRPIPKDKLKLVKRIARGTFGTVFKATWQGQTVAVKRVDVEEGVQEIKFLSELEHPNIVKLLGKVDNDLETDIILEFCDVGSLRDYLNEHRGKHLGLRFFNWTKQAGRPIAFLKTQGVVHKDIKSPNYVITKGYILKLCDFGLAKKMDATVTSATERASYQWMAPELLKDSILSPTYDIFAYGVVVWELWTTDPPFEDCEPVNVIYRVCHNNERPPIPQDCPTQIADLLKQCWETDWKKRPTMEQALSMLDLAAHNVVTGPWELVSEFGHEDGPGKLGKVDNIAVYPNGDIAVLKCGRLCVYSSETTYKFSLDLRPPHDLMTPRVEPFRNVTVNADGIIYVTCHCYVLMYTAQDGYKDRWVAMSPDNKPSDTGSTALCGLSIDANGHLLVGQIETNWYISKHREDGSHIASFNVSSIPYSLAATSHGTIIISGSYFSSTVQIVDSTGNVLHTLNENRQVTFPVTLWYPNEVCCHDDIILVCNLNLKRDNQKIQCFSVSAEYLGSIPVKNEPWGVAMTNNSQLLVECRDRVLLYRNKLLTL